jgi:hypothetical protein
VAHENRIDFGSCQGPESAKRRFDGIDGQIAKLDILAHFDEVYRRLDRLEQEYQAIVQALRRMNVLNPRST